jgi:hypothetical protein
LTSYLWFTGFITSSSFPNSILFSSIHCFRGYESSSLLFGNHTPLFMNDTSVKVSYISSYEYICKWRCKCWALLKLVLRGVKVILQYQYRSWTGQLTVSLQFCRFWRLLFILFFSISKKCFAFNIITPNNVFKYNYNSFFNSLKITYLTINSLPSKNNILASCYAVAGVTLYLSKDCISLYDKWPT